MTATIAPDIRQLIVRQLGAALADAWRRQHANQHRDQREERTEEGAADDASTSPAAT